MAERFRREGNARLVPARGSFGRINNEMGERFCQGGLVAKYHGQIIWQRRLNRDATVNTEARPRDLDSLFHGRAHVNRLKSEVGRMRKVINLGNYLVEAIDFGDDDLIEFFP